MFTAKVALLEALKMLTYKLLLLRNCCVFRSVQLECYWSDFWYFSRKEAWNCFFFESTNQPKQLVSSPVLLLSASNQNAYHLTTCWHWDTCLAKGQGSRRLSKSNHSSGGSTYSWTAESCQAAAKVQDLFGPNRWHRATVTTGTVDGVPRNPAFKNPPVEGGKLVVETSHSLQGFNCTSKRWVGKALGFLNHQQYSIIWSTVAVSQIGLSKRLPLGCGTCSKLEDPQQQQNQKFFPPTVNLK